MPDSMPKEGSDLENGDFLPAAGWTNGTAIGDSPRVLYDGRENYIFGVIWGHKVPRNKLSRSTS